MAVVRNDTRQARQAWRCQSDRGGR
jgi:hypothetical protein